MAQSPKKIKRSWKPERKSFHRDKTNYAFYNSYTWRKLSKRYKENNPLCVKCEQAGIISPAEFTDHIVRIEDGGDRFNESNLQSLCSFHHNQKSGREAHGYKEKKES